MRQLWLLKTESRYHANFVVAVGVRGYYDIMATLGFSDHPLHQWMEWICNYKLSIIISTNQSKASPVHIYGLYDSNFCLQTQAYVDKGHLYGFWQGIWQSCKSACKIDELYVRFKLLYANTNKDRQVYVTFRDFKGHLARLPMTHLCTSSTDMASRGRLWADVHVYGLVNEK